jgi:hypothetical protein
VAQAHFYDPPEVSGASIMPSYAFLFRDERGDDLVSYLESLHGSGTPQHLIAEENWHPSSSAIASGQCQRWRAQFPASLRHLPRRGRGTRWEAHFKRLPPDLAVGPFLISRLQAMPRSAGIAWRRSSNSEFPEPICPDMNTCPTTKSHPSALWLSQSIGQLESKP